MSMEIITGILNEERDKTVIEKMVENELNPELEKRRTEIILKVLEVVSKYDLDPWNIDLEKFTKIFMDEINDEFRDFPVAGKIIYFAWINLRMKSEILIPKNEVMEELQDDMFYDYSQQETENYENLSLSYIPVEKRNITVQDIIDAIKNTPLNAVRNSLKKAKKIIFQENSHPEDLHIIIKEIWRRMIDLGTDHFPMDSILEGSREDLIDVIISTLFLTYYGRTEVNQEIPYGTIWIKIVDKSEAQSPVPETKLQEDLFAV
jgi:segregation and condensation protein A